MFLVTRNPVMYLIGLGASLALTAVIYFAIVKPQLDTANNTTRDAIRQAQPALQQGNATATCVQRAGTDVAKLRACTAK
jgi:type II secretory pathway component PulM